MKIFFSCFLFLSLKIAAQNRADILIYHGKIVDGTGNSWFYGDVAVKDGKITAIGDLANWQADKMIDGCPWVY
jgi:N-acyl-D-amino-acid deacylase